MISPSSKRRDGEVALSQKVRPQGTYFPGRPNTKTRHAIPAHKVIMESAVKPAEQTVLNVLELFATTVAGLTAGGGLYISLIEAPGRGELSPSQQLRSWRTTFPRAAKCFPAACVSLALAFCTCAYQTGKSSYYVSAALFALVVLFTISTLSNINKRLMEMDVNADDDKCKQVPALVTAWAKRHVFRVVFATTGFVTALVTAVLKK